MRRIMRGVIAVVSGVIAAFAAALEAAEIYLDYRVDRLLRRKWVPGRGPTLGDSWAYVRSQRGRC